MSPQNDNNCELLGKPDCTHDDSRFRPGPDLTSKELSDHTPQGVAWWKNWDGKGNNLLLVST
ncbi:hypothetical protein QFZ23_001202 [Arthrobacter globiformis]|nr:hypothetical protein [Arthrobacter globiformis]